MKQLAIKPDTFEIIDILPEEHKFSDKEKKLYIIDLIEEESIADLLKDIRNYYELASISGATPLVVKKYYINGELSWLTV